ncbi:hypothetical protein G6514_005670 [Epicoccum nigrum]|nr:hypothetical protein G6514_005670 [Epicoccum nigrum]
MQSEHRKIELQSPSDLTYLTSQIRTAARRKLDLHLPAQPSDGADDLRAQTEALVEVFVAQVLQGLRSNVTINGLEVVAPSRGGGFGDEGEAMEGGEGVEGVEREEFEAFDEKLRARLADAVAKRDRLVGGISKHRRETAVKSARKFESAFLAEGEGVEEAVGGMVKRARQEGAGEGEGLRVGMERGEEVRRNWERAVEGVGRLNKGLPETRARLERCGGVVGYLGGGEGEVK